MACLAAACESLGLELKVDQKSYKWYGSKPNPCDHAIAIKGKKGNYEVGLVKKGDHFELECDYHDHALTKLVGKNCENITNAYTLNVTVKAANAFANENNFYMTQEVDSETQETVIKLRKY